MEAQLISSASSWGQAESSISSLDHPLHLQGGTGSKEGESQPLEGSRTYLGPFFSSEARKALFTWGPWRAWMAPLAHGPSLTSWTLERNKQTNKQTSQRKQGGDWQNN